MVIKKIFVSLFLIISTLTASPPDWLTNQSVNGYICGVGISNEKNLAIRERIAVVSARANLAENISVEILSHFKLQTKSINGKTTKYSESYIEQKSHQMLSKSKIEKRFVDSDGTLYILVLLPKTIQQLTK